MSLALHWLAICSVLLFVKMFLVSLYQGYYRITTLTFKNAEDAGFVKKDAAQEELPQVIRGAQAWANDLENIPVFFALGVLYVMVGANQEQSAALFITFTIARYLHTFFYLFKFQPWRTISYMVGIGCLFWMCFNIIKALT